MKNKNRIPLELYIHIPFCVKKCDYCDFLSFPADSNTQIRYVHALLQEIRYYGNLLGDYHVPTIYIGGGTPSWLEENLITPCCSRLLRVFMWRRMRRSASSAIRER